MLTEILNNDEIELFSKLIGLYYDAALVPDRWPAALDATRQLIGSRTAVFQDYDLLDKTPPIDSQVGYEDYYLQTLADFAGTNPVMDYVAMLGPGETAFASQHESYAILLASPFYHGWLKPQGLRDAAVLCVDKTVSTISTLVVVRGDEHPFFDERSLRILDLLYPHIRRATMIGRAIGQANARADTFAGFMDQLAAGVFFLTAKGDLRYANREGQNLLEARNVIRSTMGRLELGTEEANSAFRTTLSYSDEGNINLGSHGQTIPVRVPTGDYMAHMIPLENQRRKAFADIDGADLILCLRKEDPISARAISEVTRQYGLTQQEARVLAAVVDVGGVPLAADILGLSPSTVRTHVNNIFDKTGVRSQAGLIRILTAAVSPFEET